MGCYQNWVPIGLSISHAHKKAPNLIVTLELFHRLIILVSPCIQNIYREKISYMKKHEKNLWGFTFFMCACIYIPQN